MSKLLAVALLLLMQPGLDFAARHARDVAGNPGDLRFQIRTEKRSFQMGEAVRLSLDFSSSSREKYKLNGASYDRSGRLPTEEFVMEDATVADPFIDYFGTGVLGGIAGGLRTFPVLTDAPYTIELTLNDWFRFDRPGEYRLYLKSHRLSQLENGEMVHFAAVSNILTIEILPADANWQTANPQTPRYLATPEAIRAVLAEARKSGQSPDALALVGARDRTAMLAAFDEYLADPAVPFSAWDIRFRALFTFVAKTRPKPLPFTAWQRPVEADFVEAERRQAAFLEYVHREAVRLIPFAKNSRSAAAIAELAPEEARAAGLVPPEDYGLTRAELLAGFATFPAEQQGALLYEKWDLVRGPEMVPILRAVAASKQRLAGQALARLAELDMAAAWEVLRADLTKDEPRFGAEAERYFAAREVPEADAAFAKNLKERLALIAQFGSAGLMAPMLEAYEKKAWRTFMDQEKFLAYFLRVQPATGERLLREASSSMGGICHQIVFGGLARRGWSPAVKANVLRALDDPDPEKVIGAVRVLAAFGDGDGEAVLWKRLEVWSKTWRGRTREFRENVVTGEDPNAGQRNLGWELATGLSSAKAWVLDEAGQARLHALCIDDECRRRWPEKVDRRVVTIDVANGGAIYPPAFRVEGYASPTLAALKIKLGQFGSDTRFAWCPQPMNSFTTGELAVMRDALEAKFPGRIEACRIKY